MSSKVYIRKMMKHDMTHEVSITSYVYYDFFEGADEVFFQIDGKGYTFNVTFNNATDLRFGGEFKNMCRIIGAHEGDFLIMTRIGDHQYSLSLAKKGSSSTKQYLPYFTGTRRHLIVTSDGLNLKMQYVR